MSMNMQQRREEEKARVILESKTTAGAISTRLFILFGIYIFNIIISISKNGASSPTNYLSSSWFSILVSLAIAIVTLTIPDYDGACKRAGNCYLGTMGLSLIMILAFNRETSTGLLLLFLVAEVVLIIIYYSSFCFEMRDRLSSISDGIGFVWKAVGITIVMAYIGLLCLLFYGLTTEEITYSGAKTYLNIFKFDVYALMFSQIGFIIMLLVTGIILRQYADSPTSGDGQQQPGNPAFHNIAASQPASPKETRSPESDRIRQLREQKKLLDSGAITQEEYDARKKDLLK